MWEHTVWLTVSEKAKYYIAVVSNMYHTAKQKQNTIEMCSTYPTIINLEKKSTKDMQGRTCGQYCAHRQAVVSKYSFHSNNKNSLCLLDSASSP